MMKFIVWLLLLLTSTAHGTERSQELSPELSLNTRNDISNAKTNQINSSERESSIMIDFSAQREVDNWRITNDGVMGGLSNGTFTVDKEQGIFSGSISLENNGGFSSVFRLIETLSPDFDAIIIDVQGDGLTYQLRMVVNVEGYRLAYKYTFSTVAGQRKKLRFTLADFQASFRGRNISSAPVLRSENIREVGFLVTNKAETTFSLSVFSLQFIKR